MKKLPEMPTKASLSTGTWKTGLTDKGLIEHIEEQLASEGEICLQYYCNAAGEEDRTYMEKVAELGKQRGFTCKLAEIRTPAEEAIPGWPKFLVVELR